ncbi:MAG: hypothetical protein QN152_02410 [Armatimonadota bacterium]|nr:hypothetical protein [Armatimonadota bacterium]MDR7427741.1 hypothetical protein [Armatimonadota bacterium]MDR7464622.1 hypothetical protein [Armatimonadota bacterium]MDR7469653.1 hypothetical protein [Armatimonadota bacterium]MDR7474917.1 hypothetical protein [Armatimonadota bacterium]
MRRLGVEARAGLHAGEVEDSRVSGIVVHMAARVMSQTPVGRCGRRARSGTW